MAKNLAGRVDDWAEGMPACQTEQSKIQKPIAYQVEWAQALAFETRKKELQKAHDLLGDKIRLSEEHAYKAVMDAPNIAKVRAVHGTHTGKVIRAYVIGKLKAKPEYQAWLKRLEELQKEIESLSGQKVLCS